MPASGYLRQSALAALGLAAKAGAGPAREAGVTLRERYPPRPSSACAAAPGADFDKAVEGVLGVRPPAGSATAAGSGDTRLLWLGPDEWFAVFPDERREEVLSRLRDALAPLHAAVVDVSHTRAVIELSGAHARSVLQKGCHLDLHPSRFAAGSVAQSKFARCHVLLHQTDDAPAYDLYVHRSFARYLWAWLEDAAAEFGVRVEV